MSNKQLFCVCTQDKDNYNANNNKDIHLKNCSKGIRTVSTAKHDFPFANRQISEYYSGS